MKIIAVHAYSTRTKHPVPFVWRRGLPGSNAVNEVTWLRLVTDAGIEGWSSFPRGAKSPLAVATRLWRARSACSS